MSHLDVFMRAQLKNENEESFPIAFLFTNTFVSSSFYKFYASKRFAIHQPLEKCNVSRVLDMPDMFGFVGSFNQPFSDWNISWLRA